MPIAELEQELVQLQKLAILYNKENSFFWQFKISYLENYIKERIKEREELIQR